MPRVSAKQLDKDIFNEINSSFVSLISSLKNNNEIEGFLIDFLTKEEKLMLSKRLTLYLMIAKGYDSTFIKEVLKVSKETVRTGQIFIHTKGEVFQKILLKMKKSEESKLFWEKVEKILNKISLPMRSDRVSRGKWASGNWNQE